MNHTNTNSISENSNWLPSFIQISQFFYSPQVEMKTLPCVPQIWFNEIDFIYKDELKERLIFVKY